jgi:putative membrane protein
LNLTGLKVFLGDLKERALFTMEKKHTYDWFLRFIKGAVIGMDFVLPGISGAALAVVFGLYERIVQFVAHITKDFVKNVLFFLPVGVGGVLGIYLVSHPMSFLLDNYQTPVLWFFVGAILGTMPELWRKSGEQGRMPRHFWILGSAFILGALFLLLSRGWVAEQLMLSPATAFGAGAMVALIAFIPGFSSSNFLVLFGLYEQMINSYKALDFSILIPFALGLGIFVFPFSKGIEFLLKRVFAGFFHAIVGLVLASAVLVAVIASEGYDYLQIGSLACILTFIAGGVFSYWMCTVSKKYGA